MKWFITDLNLCRQWRKKLLICVSLWHCKAHFKLWWSLLVSPPYTGIWVCFIVLYYSTKRNLTTYCWWFWVWKAVWDHKPKVQSGGGGKKQNLSRHICVICITKNSQQLLWLGFCLKCRIDFRSCWQFKEQQETGENISVSSLAGRHRRKTHQFPHYL